MKLSSGAHIKICAEKSKITLNRMNLNILSRYKNLQQNMGQYYNKNAPRIIAQVIHSKKFHKTAHISTW